MTLIRKTSWFIFFFILTASCLDEPDCFQLNNNLLVVSFGIIGGGADQVAITGGGITSPGTDSIFYDFTLRESFQFPLNPKADNVTININEFYNNHSISIDYKRQLQYVSEDCGERYFYSELAVSDHNFDSVRVAVSLPTNPPRTNIVVYRCPRTNLAGITFRRNDGTAVVEDEVIIKNVEADFETPIFYPSQEITTLNLPLNKDVDTTTFLIEVDSEVKVITFQYERSVETLFEKCGAQTLFSELEIVSSTFTTATIVRDSVQDRPVVNVEVFQ